jgi:hypothetical protein
VLEANLNATFPVPPPVARRVKVHAYGLLHPSHMEWTQDERLLVSEFGRGRVTDITTGGDYRTAEPFAHDLIHPAGIITDYEGSRVLVADTGQGRVIDISSGGAMTLDSSVSSEIPGAYGLSQFRGDLLTVFATDTQNGVTKVGDAPFSTEQVHFGGFPNGNRDHPPYLPGIAACPTNWNTIAFGDKLLYVHSSLGAIRRFNAWPLLFRHAEVRRGTESPARNDLPSGHGSAVRHGPWDGVYQACSEAWRYQYAICSARCRRVRSAQLCAVSPIE